MMPYPCPRVKKARRSKGVAIWIGMACAFVLMLVGSVVAVARYGPLFDDERRVAPPVADGGSAIDRAIAKGVAYLKAEQKANGTWGESHPAGLAALSTLALLESGVPSTDPHVLRGLRFVREGVPTLDKTYELALAILVLDRLKQPEDDGRIEAMALRLIAGQTPGGGWSYGCPVLPSQGRDLLTALRQARPSRPGDLFVQGPDGRSLSRLFEPGVRMVGLPVQSSDSDRPLLRTDPVGGNPADRQSSSTPQAVPAFPADRQPPSAPRAVPAFPESLRGVPALQPFDKTPTLPDDDDSDNSNTQFAALALWAARHRGVPVETALARVVSRFRNSQKPTGGWGYLYQSSEAAAASLDTTTPSMTGAGLICLAMGWGLADTGTLRASEDESRNDPAIRKGLDTMGQCVGYPAGWPPRPGKPEPPLDLYYLWTLERVGVLYNVPTLGQRDWWGWGCDEILGCQRRNGSWDTGGYRGARPVTDTCFALLFLRRSDLSFGLSGQMEKLRLVKTP